MEQMIPDLALHKSSHVSAMAAKQVLHLSTGSIIEPQYQVKSTVPNRGKSLAQFLWVWYT